MRGQKTPSNPLYRSLSRQVEWDELDPEIARLFRAWQRKTPDHQLMILDAAKLNRLLDEKRDDGLFLALWTREDRVGQAARQVKENIERAIRNCYSCQGTGYCKYRLPEMNQDEYGETDCSTCRSSKQTRWLIKRFEKGQPF